VSVPTLQSLVESLGFLEVALDAGCELAHVRDVVVHDMVHPIDVHQDDLVLGVGVDPDSAEFPTLCESYAKAGASALVIKGQLPTSKWPGRPPDLSLLTVPSDIEWGHFFGLVNAALAVGRLDDLSSQSGDLENLFALCQILASRVGGPVVLHDPHWRMLAYASGQYDIDDIGRATILGRRAPQPWLERFRSEGGFERLLRGEVVHLEGGTGPSLTTRTAVAVRAGGEFLGSLWLVHQGTIAKAELVAIMRETAAIAALQLVRSRVETSAAGRAETEVLASLLSGAPATPTLAERLGCPMDAPLLLAAFRPSGLNDLDLAVTLERLSATLRMVCDAYRLPATRCVVDGSLYVLIRLSSANARSGGIRVLREFHRQIAETPSLVFAAIARPIEGLHELVRARKDIRILGDLQADERIKPDEPADFEDYQVEMEYEALREVMRASSDVFSSATLTTLQRETQADDGVLETLRAYFVAGGDVLAAGKALAVHPNTVRYRLRKMQDHLGIDLEDPTQRFLLELRVRLLC